MTKEEQIELADKIYEANRPKFHDWGTLKQMCIASMQEYAEQVFNERGAGVELFKKCDKCGGDGYTAEHDFDCDGSCNHCPVQVQCEYCATRGFVPYLPESTVVVKDRDNSNHCICETETEEAICGQYCNKRIAQSGNKIPSPNTSLLDALKEITEICGTVNFSSHNQMREAIEQSLELSESAISSASGGGE